MDEKLVEKTLKEFGDPVTINEVSNNVGETHYEIEYMHDLVRISFPTSNNPVRERTMVELYASVHQYLTEIAQLQSETEDIVKSFFAMFMYFARVNNIPLSKFSFETEDNQEGN